MRTLALGVAAIACVLSAPAFAADKVTVTLDASKTGAKIDRHIFGQFAEHLGHGIYEGVWVGKDSKIANTNGMRNDVVAALKDLKIPNVRWPGGCFADEYNWRRGIGPADQRKAAMNANWGGVIEPNTFGTDEFMEFVRQIDSQAYVSVNVGSGTPLEAAEWLEYMTSSTEDALGAERAKNGHAAPYEVPFVGLGNEAWGCGGAMTADEYVTEMKRYARFVRNYNPKQPMKRIAVGPDGGDISYTEAVMKAWKNKVWAWDIEGLSLHSYTVPKWPPAMPGSGFGEDDYALILQTTLKMEELVSKHSAVMDTYDPEKKVALVVDEWGAWYAPAPGTNPGFLIQQNSQRDAILAAVNLNIFARHADRVRMANIAQMVNVLQAMILTDGNKMLLTPTYHVFKMYIPFQDATFVPVSYDAGKYTRGAITLPRVDIVAAKDTSGKLWLSLTNLDPNQPAEIDAALLGLKAKSATGQTLTAPKIDSVNTFEAPTTITPKPISAKVKDGKLMLKLTPESVTVVSLD